MKNTVLNGAMRPAEFVPVVTRRIIIRPRAKRIPPFYLRFVTIRLTSRNNSPIRNLTKMGDFDLPRVSSGKILAGILPTSVDDLPEIRVQLGSLFCLTKREPASRIGSNKLSINWDQLA